jgi:23S rRNA pseudouridine1911/1915/1917 synthase
MRLENNKMFIGSEINVLEYKIEKEQDGLKIKEILVDHMKLSSRLIIRSKQNKCVSLNEVSSPVSKVVYEGDILKVRMTEEANIFDPEDIDIEVIFENQDILVIAKQPYKVVHPTKGHPMGTIANGVANYFYSKGNFRKIRFINRLDRDTSGLLLIAKNSYAQQVISNQMRDNTVEKKYYALVEGIMDEKEGTINLPIGRLDEVDIKRCVMEDGQKSITHYKVEREFKDATLVEVTLETGRTHQIRVHFSHMGHPLIGDELYGNISERINRQALHGYSLKFKLPRDGELVELKSELPYDFLELIKYLDE